MVRLHSSSGRIPLRNAVGISIALAVLLGAVLERANAWETEEMIKTRGDSLKIAFVLGQASHFIHDLNVPLHAVVGESQQQHAAYERSASFPTWPGAQYGYRGFFLVKNDKCFARETAERSGKHAYDAMKPVPPRAVIERTWNDAVNDTANLLQSIFYRALGPETSQALYGIPTPKGVIGDGWLCGL